MPEYGLRRVKIFADGADLEGILELAARPDIAGFTTNPTLMRQSGVSDYEGFARKVLERITDRPISFEVFADDFGEMLRQARFIASWGPNVYVKIPITDTRGTSTAEVVRTLADEGVHLNVTALMTVRQVETAAGALAGGPEAIISVFAGRIADTGRDPVPIMREALALLAPYPQLQLLWASPREILNVTQADELGVPHHHGHARPAEEAVEPGPRSRRLLAGHRAHVPRRRPSGRLPAVTARDDVGPPEGAQIDDWDHHWDSYGEAAEGNPANDYRRSLVRKLLGRPPAGSVVLDIGSGQGELAIHVRELYPDVAVRGVEYSASGVRRSRAAAAARGVEVTFTQRDLLEPVTLEPGEPAATHAICSEVLEHVDDPVALLRNAINLLAPGARVVVTVPGGPRSAFDKHIGHRTGTSRPIGCTVCSPTAGWRSSAYCAPASRSSTCTSWRSSLRGRRLIADVGSRPAGAAQSRAETIVINAFRKGFAVNRDDFPFGWQMAAVARVPASGEAAPSS